MPLKFQADGQNKFGFNPNIGNGVEEDVWDGGGDYVFPTTARIHALSGHAEDNPAGTGTGSVLVRGLDIDDMEIEETVILNGATPVNTTKAYSSIYRMRSISGNTNVGNINAVAAVDTTLTARITAAKGQTLMAIYVVPAGKDLFLNQYYGGAGKAQAAAVDVSIFIAELGQPFSIRHAIPANSAGSTYVRHSAKPWVKIPARSRIKIRAASSANNTVVYAGFDGTFSNHQ